MDSNIRSGLHFLLGRFSAVFLVMVSLGSAVAEAATCGTFKSCPDGYYCPNPLDVTDNTTCKARGDAGNFCVPPGQSTCKDGLVCDALFECRHSPPREGEPCGIGVSCASGLTCSADVGGRCYTPGQAGDSCSGIGQGSCASGLVCDANRTCRHDPPQLGEPCGIGVSCAGDLACSSPVAGTCEARGQAGDGCIGIGQGTCASGLVCDALLECRHSPPEFGEPCGVGVSCAGDLACSSPVAGRCESRGQAGDFCYGIGQGTCESGLVCDASFQCRHDPPERGEPCGIGVACAGSLVCSADIAGTCGDRGGSGDSCSGVGQGSCQAGLVCEVSARMPPRPAPARRAVPVHSSRVLTGSSARGAPRLQGVQDRRRGLLGIQPRACRVSPATRASRRRVTTPCSASPTPTTGRSTSRPA